jgi:hypothetical protein
MDATDRAILEMLWDLVLKQRELLSLMVPTCQDVAEALIKGNSPTPQPHISLFLQSLTKQARYVL